MGFTQLCHTKSRANSMDKLADKHPGTSQRMSLPTFSVWFSSIHSPIPMIYPLTHLLTHPFIHILRSGLLFNPKFAPCFQGKNTPSKSGWQSSLSATLHLSGFWLCHLYPLGCQPCSHSCTHSWCPPRLAPTPSPLPGRPPGNAETGRGEKGPRGSLCLHSPTPRQSEPSRCTKPYTELCVPA